MPSIIVDNSDGGYAETGTWNNSSNAGAYNNSFRYSVTSGDHADFALSGETNAQVYDAYVSYLWQAGRTPAASCIWKGHAGATLLTASVDQTVDPSTLTGNLVITDSGSRAINFTHVGQITADGTTGSVVISHADSAVLTVDAVMLVPFVPTTTIPVTDTNVYYSPYNWYSDGGGGLTSHNIKGSSTYVRTACMGAYLKIAVTGTTTFKLTVDTAAAVAASVVTLGYPELSYSVNGGPILSAQLAAAVANGISLTGLSGTSQIQIWVKSINQNYDTYNTSTGPKITGFVVDFGGSTVALAGYYAVKSKNMIVYGDSISCGYKALGLTDDTYSDSTVCYVRFLAEQLGAEVGVRAVGGIGYTHVGSGNFPVVPTSYAFYESGHSLLVGGVLSPIPDYAHVALGTNDNADGTLTTAIQAFLGTMRTICGAACPILQQVPFNGLARANVTTAVAGAADSKVHITDAGTSFQTYLLSDTAGGLSVRSTDGVHPNQRGHAEAAARVAYSTALALGGGSSATFSNTFGGFLE